MTDYAKTLAATGTSVVLVTSLGIWLGTGLIVLGVVLMALVARTYFPLGK